MSNLRKNIVADRFFFGCELSVLAPVESGLVPLAKIGKPMLHFIYVNCWSKHIDSKFEFFPATANAVVLCPQKGTVLPGQCAPISTTKGVGLQRRTPTKLEGPD